MTRTTITIRCQVWLNAAAAAAILRRTLRPASDGAGDLTCGLWAQEVRRHRGPQGRRSNELDRARYVDDLWTGSVVALYTGLSLRKENVYPMWMYLRACVWSQMYRPVLLAAIVA